MIYDKTQTIEAFLNAAAARQPTPGGGSATALAAALAAAMTQMVVNYSLGKKDLAQHQDELKQAMDQLNRAMQILLELMIEDQAAYEAFSQARKLPQDDPQRSGKLQAALLACIRVPQAIGATSAEILRLCDRLADRTNRYLLSDLAVAAELAMAAVRCSAHSVTANLSELTDPADKAGFQSALSSQNARCVGLIRSAIARIGMQLAR